MIDIESPQNNVYWLLYIGLPVWKDISLQRHNKYHPHDPRPPPTKSF